MKVTFQFCSHSMHAYITHSPLRR